LANEKSQARAFRLRKFMKVKGEKLEVLGSVSDFLQQNNFEIIAKDFERPWGGFFVINEGQALEFIAKFFPHLSIDDFRNYEKLSPKILVVAPEKRLSWQYHFRRAEIWKLIAGSAGVAVSETDLETSPKSLAIGQVINLKCGQRHRLIGENEAFGIVAEIWQHTDPQNPSDESDIVRIQDDFGR
jgi:mannose-6-phosphate isomerase